MRAIIQKRDCTSWQRSARPRLFGHKSKIADVGRTKAWSRVGCDWNEFVFFTRPMCTRQIDWDCIVLSTHRSTRLIHVKNSSREWVVHLSQLKNVSHSCQPVTTTKVRVSEHELVVIRYISVSWPHRMQYAIIRSKYTAEPNLMTVNAYCWEIAFYWEEGHRQTHRVHLPGAPVQVDKYCEQLKDVKYEQRAITPFVHVVI